jgi:acyl transferase domain-containing protein/acyl carrier protein
MARKSHEVAIVGMGCRLPGGVGNPDRLAVFLREHGDGVCLVPPNRWSIEDHFDPDPKTPGKAYVRHGGFLTDDVFSFDPAPFGISPREADRLDPQQRLLLEVTWEAFEDAGIPLDSLRGSDTAAFVGGFTQDHQLIAMSDANRDLIDSHTSVGASMTVLSNRISYTFDWHGASATVDTACSSSLVAFHLACEEIRAGRSSVAVAGGVNVMLTPTTTIAMCKGQFLAPDGRSKSFDARADGYGRGEGAGIVVLKRRDLAERDGDRIHAIVCATGVNQDGRTDGMPMPNGEAQLRLARSVLADSGLAARDVAYVEAHGTGTRAGDPVELRALGGAYGEQRDVPLVVGSIKSNIGHLEAAAGITGLVKAVLSVSRREIFPLRELKEPNPAVPLAALNIELAVEPRAWPNAGRACAAVNSFGYGGTNAHAIIAEYQSFAPANSNRPLAPTTASEPGAPRGTSRPSLVPVSAACHPALRVRAADVASQCNEATWSDVAHTLACARAALTERAVLLVHDGDGLASELGKLAANETSEHRVTGRAVAERKLLWVFTGMGPQRPGMGRELYEHEPVFRAAVEEADAAFRENAGWSVLAAMLEPADRSSMKANFVAQPANFVLQVGLVALLRDLGVPEHGMLGHSIGELAAAWASGCLSLREAARITFHRSRLQQTKAGTGGMLAVGAKESDIAALLSDQPDLHVAAFNGPKSLTLAGPTKALARAAETLEKQGIFQRRVPVEVAYHSPELESLRPEFMQSLGAVAFEAARQPLYSTADGVRLRAAAHDTEYWWRNAREPVLLQRALEAAIADGFDAFLEVGPHPVLGPSIREVLSHLHRDGHLAYTMRRDQNEPATVLRNVAELYANGTSLDWSRLGHAGRRVRLPSYPFQRRTHWVESKESQDARLGRSRSQPLLAQRDGGPSPRFSTPLSRPSLAYLQDHRIEGRAVFPAAGYLEATLGACIELTTECSGCVLEDVRFERVFVLRPEASPTLVVDVPSGDGYVGLYGKHRGDGWERKAHARVRSTTAEPEQQLALAPLEQDLPIELDVERLYGELAELGLEYGPAFRRLATVNVRRDGRGGGALLARLSDVAAGNPAACVHPTLLDAGFHALLALNADATGPLVPTAIRRLAWWDGREPPRWVYGVVSRQDDGTFTAELKIAGASGRVLVDVRGLEFQPLSAGDGPAKHEAWLHVDGFELVDPVPALQSEVGALALYGSARALPLGARERFLRLSGSIRTVTESELESLRGDERLVVTFETRDAADGGVAAIDEFRALLAKLGYAGGELRLVTLGAQALTSSERPDPVQAALAGFARVVMTERPELALRIIDTTPDCDRDTLLALLLDPNLDEEVALRGDELYTRKLRRFEERPSTPRGSTLFSLSARPSLPPGSAEHELRGGDIEVRALAAAVHRADLTSALRPSGFGSGPRPARGRAICGQVVRVGSHVRNVRVGDRVHTFQEGDLTASIRVPEERVVRVPAECDATRIAASEAYVAAWYALTEIARTTPGDAVIVEGADTPAGLAAVEVARSLGAKIIATVDDPARREALLAQGASAVLLSDQVDLEGRVRALAPTGARAVVSAADSIERQLLFALLGAGGHFVALTAAALADLRSAELPFGISLGSVSLARAVREAPRSYADAARAVLARLARHELEIPAPKTFVPADAAAAFESLSFGEDAPLVIDLSAERPEADAPGSLAPFRKDRSYLVTGGLAGLGLATAEWMANLGAGTIVLASRRGVPDQEAAKSVARMRGAGAQVICTELDVSDADSLAELLSRIRRDLPVLAGVFHAATVFADGPLESITTGSLLRAMSAKARGAWLLHEQTQTDALDHFVLFSSVSALIGNPNQAAYAAANAYLDGLADLRRADGLPALSLSFGAIKDAGVVARDAATRAHLASLGIRPMAARLTLAALLTAMASSEARLGIVDMDWDRWAASFPATSWRRLSELVTGTSAAADSASVLKAELSTLDPDARDARLTERLRETAASVLRLAPENLDPVASFRNHGLDSLMALELQAAIEKTTGISVPTIEILAGVAVRDLVAFVLARLEAPAPAPAGARASTRSAPAVMRRPLQERLLAQICVQPPYFALEDLVARGEWVHARARAVPSRASEAGLVSCAEAARHLAIAGSCAVSLASPIAGRVYYPVWKASYDVAWRAAALRPAPLETLLLSARCLDFDEKASLARAETRLCDERGEVLQTLLVDYHVIPERHFRELFAGQARPTAEATSPDPYASWLPLPGAPIETARGSRLTLGTVVPEQCLGHFVGYPALPVSIMTRYAVDLVAEARKVRSAAEAIHVTSGDVETKAFVFAGQVAALEVWAGEVGADGSERWHGEVTGDGRLAAVFRFDVRSAQPRTSGIYDTSILQPAKVAD